MDRINSIEQLLLSRCSRFNQTGKVLKFLEERYSFTGPQKNYLVLESTEGDEFKNEERKAEKKELASVDKYSKQKPIIFSQNKFDPYKTKNEFKRLIQNTLKKQKQIAKKLHKLSKSKPQILEEDVKDLKICRELLLFEDFLEMHNLWKNYMKDLIRGSKTIDLITAKLSVAEFVGAYFRVTHSFCPENIGLEGIVIWESQTYVLLIVPRRYNWKGNVPNKLPQIPYTSNDCIGGLRMIAKKSTRFVFDIEVEDSSDILPFEFIGDRMSIRSLDRANKKFKSHSVKDIEV